jgi:uncharacterized protein with HEPN domain
MRAVEIIGEAASKISAETRMDYPDIPWRAIIAMRNRLVHAYYDVDHNVLWKTSCEEVPSLLTLLRAIEIKG